MADVRRERFELALDLLKPAQWVLFEELASDFLATEFPDLRTMANSAGDRGRDATLFTTADDQTTCFQYSVTTDWDKKIRETLKRLEGEFQGQTRVLVYLTNAQIGAAADPLRAAVKKSHVLLDIRDRSWFLERANTSTNRQAAAERLIDQVVQPFLASKSVVEGKAQALQGAELRVAAVHLGLQWEDDTREKGLTRLCFQALIRGVLQDSSPDKLLTRNEIRQRVRVVMPSHSISAVDTQTDGALASLTKRFVRHYKKEDSYCLTHDERTRIQEMLATLEQADRSFQTEVQDVVAAKSAQWNLPTALATCAQQRTRTALEKVLLSLGESFANAVRTAEMRSLGLKEVREIVLADLATDPPPTKDYSVLVDAMSESISQIISEAGPASRVYLRRLADSYTLLAFLREVPDVQAAMVKMFSHGEIWLDTSLLLPLMVEELIEDPESRSFSSMLRAAKDSGLSLRVTQGVVDEVERHISHALNCLRTGTEWRSRTPFLLAAYLTSGRAPVAFQTWTEMFAGPSRPIDDVADYIRDVHGIEVGGLEQQFRQLPEDQRYAIQEIWNEIHEGRRGRNHEVDAITVQRLAYHDAENYGGVLQKRTQERDSPLGYSTWWLTLDRSAFEIREQLSRRLARDAPHSPVMSPDFLVNYLAFGPVRARLGKGAEAKLPVMLDIGRAELPAELLEIAARVRAESEGQDERLIRRRVRDALDRAKTARGTSSVPSLSIVFAVRRMPSVDGQHGAIVNEFGTN